jgi:hypothetical protein
LVGVNPKITYRLAILWSKGTETPGGSSMISIDPVLSRAECTSLYGLNLLVTSLRGNHGLMWRAKFQNFVENFNFA